MAVEFVGISTAYIASGASSITIARPAGTVEGDVMLLVAYARLGTFAAASTDPPGQNYGNFEVLADNGTRWTTRYNAQNLLYRPVLASEPTSYTFEFTTTAPGYGAVEDNYIVATIVAYRGAETADPVGAFDSIGDPIPYGDRGYSEDPGRQFEANPYYSAGGSGDSPWGACYWFTRVDGMRAVFVVIVDWSTPIYHPDTDAPFTWPDPPADVEVVFPDGWVERTPAGSWLKIADGPPATDPNFDGAEDVGPGTWRGRATQSWDIGSYTLSSPTLATPDMVLGGHTFELDASSTYLPVYAGADVVPPPAVVVTTAAIRGQRVRTEPPVIIRVGGPSVVASAVAEVVPGLATGSFAPDPDTGNLEASIGAWVPNDPTSHAVVRDTTLARSGAASLRVTNTVTPIGSTDTRAVAICTLAPVATGPAPGGVGSITVSGRYYVSSSDAVPFEVVAMYLDVYPGDFSDSWFGQTIHDIFHDVPVTFDAWTQIAVTVGDLDPARAAIFDIVVLGGAYDTPQIPAGAFMRWDDFTFEGALSVASLPPSRGTATARVAGERLRVH